jgi:hypothetical protein
MDLCGLLAFWTNRDAERMDRLFQRSALIRQKWERGDYRRRTIERAITGCKSGYTPRPKALPEIGEAIRKLQAWAEQEPWTGKGGPTDWKAFGYLLNTGGGYGRARRGGIEVSAAQRDIALAIGQARSSAKRSMERLEAERRIEVLDPGSAKHPARILIRYLPESVHIEKNPPEPPPVFNMDRLRELLFKVRNPPPDMPPYDRDGRRITPTRSELLSPLGGLGALVIEKLALSPGLTGSQLAKRLGRRREKVEPVLLALLGPGLIVEASGVYRAPADLLERLELELERSGCNKAERRDRVRYEDDRRARRQFAQERREPARGPDGLTEDLERVEAEPAEVFAPQVTDHTDPKQFRELAALIRSEVEARRAANPLSASELARRHLDRLRKEHPDSYARYRLEPRKLSWEIAGLGWTRTVYSHDTISRALSELEPVEVAA